MTNPPYIMVFNDDHPICELLTRALGDLGGYRVETFDDGHVALRRFNLRVPDVIVCDTLMGGMTGLDFYDRVRAVPAWEGIPFVWYAPELPPYVETDPRVTGEIRLTMPENGPLEVLSVVQRILASLNT